MSVTRVLTAVLATSLMASAVVAQQSNSQKDPGVLRLHLMEGSVITGRFVTEIITVTTEFGTLRIPLTKIVSFTPGLDNQPQVRQRINTLILQLGANTAKVRDQAERELANMGFAVKTLLESFRNDKDVERKNRIGRLLQQVEQLREEAEEGDEKPPQALIAEDTVQTIKFTVVGKISPKSFSILTKYGPLTVALSDIRRAAKVVEATPILRRTITVTGQNLVTKNYKSTKILLNRGDRVTIEASGSIILTPWGNNVRTGPDGTSDYGTYKPGIQVGALVGRIGTSGKEFKVGSSHKFTATKSGQLYFAVAMSSGQINSSFPGEYKVKVRVTPASSEKSTSPAKPANRKTPAIDTPKKGVRRKKTVKTRAPIRKTKTKK